MKKQFLLILILLLVVAAILFYEQVLAIFHGMTVLESMRFIVNFVLHVAVVTILVYGLYTLPEIFSPWMKALRFKRRQTRRQRNPQTTPARVKSSRLDNEQLIQLLLKQSNSRARREPTPSQDNLPLDF